MISVKELAYAKFTLLIGFGKKEKGALPRLQGVGNKNMPSHIYRTLARSITLRAKAR